MTEPFDFEVPAADCRVSALFQSPDSPRSVYVMAHGAGAGMTHPFMAGMADELAARRIATLRYQFPYMERRRRRPDPAARLTATARAAAATARRRLPGLPVLAGGKSMGGRMTSRAAAEEALPGVQGIVFLGFPLHPAGRPGTERAEHLDAVGVPMLFVQGTRDRLAELSLLQPICEALGHRARLRIVEDADHSFHVPKRSGRTDAQVLKEIADTVALWCTEVIGIPESS